MMYSIVGAILCLLSFGWISLAGNYAVWGWIGVIIGGYLFLKGRKKMGVEEDSSKFS